MLDGQPGTPGPPAARLGHGQVLLAALHGRGGVMEVKLIWGQH